MTRQTIRNMLVHFVVIVMAVASLLDLDAETLQMQSFDRLASTPPHSIEVIRDCTETKHTQGVSAVTTIAVRFLILTAAAVMTLAAVIAAVVKTFATTVNNSGAARAFLAVTTAITQFAMTVHAAVALLVTLFASLAEVATAIIFRLLTSRAALYLLVIQVWRRGWSWHIRNLFLWGS